jgi:hypothetical protein
MNLRYRDRLYVDEEGDELPNSGAVQAHAMQTARDLIAGARLTTIRNWFDCTFEVTDESGTLVLEMPFSDTIADRVET